MIYATLADLVARFSQRELAQLTDLDNIPPSEVDAVLVDTKLADASAFVDGYVGQMYRLPLRGCTKPTGVNMVEQVPPPVLTRLTCDLARYYLYDDLAPENEVYRRYKAALAELGNIASGKTLLACPWGGSAGDLVGAADAQSGGAETFSSFGGRSITDDTLRGFA